MDGDCGSIVALGFSYEQRTADRALSKSTKCRRIAASALRVDVVNPACGDMLRLCARVEDGSVAEVTFKARGCVASIAASSALTEMLQGMDRASLLGLQPADVEAAVGGLAPNPSTLPNCALTQYGRSASAGKRF
jgi:NifU-like protein involved in Fe-S cluster formation